MTAPVGCYWAGLSQVSNTLTISSSQTHCAHCARPPQRLTSPSSQSLSASLSAQSWSLLNFKVCTNLWNDWSFLGIFGTSICWRTECLSCQAVLSLFKLMGEANANANGFLSTALSLSLCQLDLCLKRGTLWQQECYCMQALQSSEILHKQAQLPLRVRRLWIMRQRRIEEGGGRKGEQGMENPQWGLPPQNWPRPISRSEGPTDKVPQ